VACTLFEERALYLRLSVTDACDFRCWYCQPEARVPAPASEPRLAPGRILELVDALHRAVHLRKVRITGGEPLLRADLPEIIAGIRERLPEAELALTTNGHRLSALAPALRRAGLGRINVSLDSVDPETFQRITGVDALARVRAGLQAAREAGFDGLKLNSVLLRSSARAVQGSRRTENAINGDKAPFPAAARSAMIGGEPRKTALFRGEGGWDIPPERSHSAGARLEELVRFAAHQGLELRFIELMPLGPGAARHDEEFLSAAEALALLERGGAPEHALPSSSTAERHLFWRDGLPVVVGFIPSVTRPFCGTCDRLRLDSRGRLRACLRGERQLDLVSLQAESPAALEAAVRELAARKRSPRDAWPDLSMTRIGG